MDALTRSNSFGACCNVNTNRYAAQDTPTPSTDFQCCDAPSLNSRRHMNAPSVQHCRACLFTLLLSIALIAPASSCGPGRIMGPGRRIQLGPPLVYKQHVPNMPEHTLGASGPSLGPIKRDTKRFYSLVPVNPRLVRVKDEEGTGADRLMSRRCKEKLDTLIVAVNNMWPGMKVRIIDSWSEEHLHGKDSLLYEGRAIMITTSDRDRSKYGMLGRLAVDAGFDWVYYSSRAHIYCSVKADSTTRPTAYGCFSPDDTVQLESGVHMPMVNLAIGDRVLSMNSNNEAVYSEVILFLDRNAAQTQDFVHVITADGAQLALTRAHLIWVWNPKKQLSAYIYADEIEINDYVLVHDIVGHLRPQRVSALHVKRGRGIYAPLTREGTIVVNSVAASCYAYVRSHTLAQLSMAPMRAWATVRAWLSYVGLMAPESSTQIQVGVHWYAGMLNTLKDYVAPRSWFHK